MFEWPGFLMWIIYRKIAGRDTRWLVVHMTVLFCNCLPTYTFWLMNFIDFKRLWIEITVRRWWNIRRTLWTPSSNLDILPRNYTWKGLCLKVALPQKSYFNYAAVTFNTLYMCFSLFNAKLLVFFNAIFLVTWRH